MSVPEDFEDFISALRELFFALRATSNDLLADLGCTAVERSVLTDLNKDGPQTVPDLAFARAVSRQTMQKTVDRLLDRRWLEVRDNPRHQRSVLLALAPAGQRLLEQIQARERRLLAGTPLPLSGGELRRTTAALRALRQTVGGGAAPGRAQGTNR
jgi:DNA-binding MarR family transcriptional regulator